MTARQRIAVLGSNSFSGADFIDVLLETGRYDVLGISRAPEVTPLFAAYHRHGRAHMRFLQADLNTALPSIMEALAAWRPTVIVNFAAQSEVGPSWEHPEHWMQTNVASFAVLLNQLRRCAWLERYLQISSPEVYGSCAQPLHEDAPLHPSTPYAVSKAAADMLLQTFVCQYRFPALWVRSTNVYGAHQQLHKIIPRTAIAAKRGAKIPLHGGGRAVKSYIHIRDISRGELAILEHGTVGEIYHLAPDHGVAVRDVVAQLATLLGVAWPDLVNDVAERPGQDAAYLIDATKARTTLGWQPATPLATGLRDVVTWIETHWNELRDRPLEYVHRV
ncbi:MAG: GDP-mannose 4,6-dehydratase [Deltaproteobacteria bacterium]|nr:GDP-mannose 4,6-dehydratase [Deltaproteobacteria bacterium]